MLSVVLHPALFFAGLDWAAGDVQVAMERPNGRLVDLMLKAGHPVVPVPPNAIKAWRDGEVLSGAKSGAGDAAVIAECLRLRQHRLRVVVPYSNDTRALRTVARTATELLDRLRAAPAGAGGEALSEALRDAVLALVCLLTALNAAVKGLDRSSAAHLGYETPDSVAALAGCTPVTKESGKHRAVHCRWVCDKRLRVAMTTFADNSHHAGPWAAKIYGDAREAGKDRPHAIRIVACAWIRVL